MANNICSYPEWDFDVWGVSYVEDKDGIVHTAEYLIAMGVPLEVAASLKKTAHYDSVYFEIYHVHEARGLPDTDVPGAYPETEKHRWTNICWSRHATKFHFETEVENDDLPF